MAYGKKGFRYPKAAGSENKLLNGQILACCAKPSRERHRKLAQPAYAPRGLSAAAPSAFVEIALFTIASHGGAVANRASAAS
jgi:hypothetical protein